MPNSSMALSVAAERLVIPAGTTAGTIVRETGLATSGPEAIVVVGDPSGGLRDLTWRPEATVEVMPIAAGTADGRNVIRRSAGHVLVQAVQRLYPAAKLGTGPAARDGFGYDFDVPRPFTMDDLAEIEHEMRQIILAEQRFARRSAESAEAVRQEFAAEPYKVALVSLLEIEGTVPTIYDNLDPRSNTRVWSDMCPGPHVPTTGHIPAFKLLRTAAVKNAGLQRIYGTAWEAPMALDAYLNRRTHTEWKP